MVLRRIEHEEMGTGPVMRTLVTLAIPAVASSILQCLYQFVDMVYIGRLGTDELKAVTTAMSPMFILFSLGIAPAVGVTALASRYLGANEPARARRILDHALGVAFVVGSTVTLIGALFPARILALYGPKEETLAVGAAYFGIMAAGGVLMHLGIVADAALRAQGNTVTPMKVMMAANVMNIVLDPFLIFGPEDVGLLGPKMAWLFDPVARMGLGMGVRGAAIATLLSRGLMTAVLLRCVWARTSRLRPSRPGRGALHPDLGTVGRVYFVGLPSTLSHLGMSISFGVLIRMLNGIDPEAVAVLGVGMSLERFAFFPIFGLFQAVMPMVGYNLGAKKLDRCKQTIRSGCYIASALMGSLGIVLVVWPQVFVAVFNDDPNLLAAGSRYLRINCWVYAFIGCDIMLSAGFQGFGRTWYAMGCQMWRVVLMRLPLAYLLAVYLQWGVEGVWWSFPIANLSCFGISVWIMLWLLKRIEHEAAPPVQSAEELEALSSEVADLPDIP